MHRPLEGCRVGRELDNLEVRTDVQQVSGMWITLASVTTARTCTGIGVRRPNSSLPGCTDAMLWPQPLFKPVWMPAITRTVQNILPVLRRRLTTHGWIIQAIPPMHSVTTSQLTAQAKTSDNPNIVSPMDRSMPDVARVQPWIRQLPDLPHFAHRSRPR